MIVHKCDSCKTDITNWIEARISVHLSGDAAESSKVERIFQRFAKPYELCPDCARKILFGATGQDPGDYRRVIKV